MRDFLDLGSTLTDADSDSELVHLFCADVVTRSYSFNLDISSKAAIFFFFFSRRTVRFESSDFILSRISATQVQILEKCETVLT